MAGRALQMIGSDARIERPDFDISDFKDLHAPYENGLIICNPPYGERLGEEEQAKELYRSMSSLFTDFPGWEIGVITSNKHFQECIAHYASTLKDLKAGNLDTTFYMYNGTEKEKKGRTGNGSFTERSRSNEWNRKPARNKFNSNRGKKEWR